VKEKTIAGYGAAPNTTTLMYYFDLWKYLKFLIDDNPSNKDALVLDATFPFTHLKF